MGANGSPSQLAGTGRVRPTPPRSPVLRRESRFSGRLLLLPRFPGRQGPRVHLLRGFAHAEPSHQTGLAWRGASVSQAARRARFTTLVPELTRRPASAADHVQPRETRKEQQSAASMPHNRKGAYETPCIVPSVSSLASTSGGKRVPGVLGRHGYAADVCPFGVSNSRDGSTQQAVAADRARRA